MDAYTPALNFEYCKVFKSNFLHNLHELINVDSCWKIVT